MLIVADPVEGWIQPHGPYKATDSDLAISAQRLQADAPHRLVEIWEIKPESTAEAQLWFLDHTWSPKKETGRERLH